MIWKPYTDEFSHQQRQLLSWIAHNNLDVELYAEDLLQCVQRISNGEISQKKYQVWLTMDFATDDGTLWSNQIKPFYQDLADKIKQAKDQYFIILSTLINVEKLFANFPGNFKCGHIGADMLWTQAAMFATLPPLLDKNFASEKTWISVSAMCLEMRKHRPLSAIILHGLDLIRHGRIRNSAEMFAGYSSWSEFRDDMICQHGHDSLRILDQWQHVMHTGFEKFLQSPVDHETTDQIYSKTGYNNHVKNYETYLVPMYRDSFVEIINETIFFQPAGLITEKTLQTILGCNFMIMLGVPHSVKYLRDMGFDMFDDVVNHAYDHEQEPLNRLVKAIEDNLILLSDPGYTKQKWLECRSRFVYNHSVLGRWLRHERCLIESKFLEFFQNHVSQ